MSPTFNTALRAMLSSKGSAMGRGLMLGPRFTSTVSISASSMGGTIMLSLIKKRSGMGMDATPPRPRGSVNTPAMAEAAAVSGLTR